MPTIGPPRTAFSLVVLCQVYFCSYIMTCVFLGLTVAFAIPSYGTRTSEWDIIDAILRLKYLSGMA